MYCKITDLVVEVPAAGGMASRCEEYLYTGDESADITICAERYDGTKWRSTNENLIAYMESGRQFYINLLRFNGMMLHASAVELDGKAYLFSGNCGTGKSTHTKLWQKVFGEAAQVFNDDKPALRYQEGHWYAYGTPWCGKNGINQNKKVPVAGICFLKQASENKIRRLNTQEALKNILFQTVKKLETKEMLELLISNLELLLKEIPVYELENRPEPDAVRLSYETMRRGAEEIGL